MPRDIQFTDTSAPGDGSRTITGRSWEIIGGAEFSTAQNPLLTGAADTSFDVRLTVTQDDDQTDIYQDTIPAAVVDTAPTIAIDNGAAGTLTEGDTLQLAVTMSGSPAPTATYASDNPSVATVDAAGLVTAVAAGTATVTATANNRAGSASDTYVLTVEAAASVTVHLEAQFTGADGTDLAIGYAPEKGGPLVQVGATVGKILANRARGGTGSKAQHYFTTEPPSGSYDIPFSVRRIGSAFTFAIYARWDGIDASNFYALNFSDAMITIRKTLTGALSTLSTPGADYTHGLVAGQDFTGIFRLNGTTIQLLAADGTTVLIDAADSSLSGAPGANRVGFNNASGTTNGFHLDYIRVQAVA